MPSRQNVDRRSSSRPPSGPNGRSMQPRRVAGQVVVRAAAPRASRPSRSRGRLVRAAARPAGIDEHQPLVHVEGEHRDVDRAHHARAAAPSIRPPPMRCRCSVSPSELISFITRSTALPGFAPVAADRVVPFVQRAEQVGCEVEHARAPSGTRPRAQPIHTASDDARRASSAPRSCSSGPRRSRPARPPRAGRRASVRPSTACSRLRSATPRRSRLAHGRHTAAAAGRARCGSCRAAARPAGRRRRGAPGPFR